MKYTLFGKASSLVFLCLLTPCYGNPYNQSNANLVTEIQTTKNALSVKFAKQKNEILDALQHQEMIIKKEALFNKLEQSMQALEADPVYALYALLTQTIVLIGQLQAYNHTITHSDLLIKTNAHLDKLVNQEPLSSLRSLLKKQRTALIELLDEKELIENNEKNLKKQYQEISQMLDSKKQELSETPAYKQVLEVQAKYLELNSVKKMMGLIDKWYDTDTQHQIALLKDKPYQKMLRTLQNIDPTFNTQSVTDEATFLALQQHLFLIPLDTVL